MSYTVISEGIPAPSATVVDNVLAALHLARSVEKDGHEVTIASDSGWILTSDQLEELVRQ